jgi:hypothetical protein
MVVTFNDGFGALYGTVIPQMLRASVHRTIKKKTFYFWAVVFFKSSIIRGLKSLQITNEQKQDISDIF